MNTTFLSSVRRRTAFALTLAISLATAGTMRAADQNDVVMHAMRDELARSTAELKLGTLEKPYFISYRITERRSQNVGAEFGSTVGRSEFRNRMLSVEVRVGSPALDNTNFQSTSSVAMMLSSSMGAPVASDDDYGALRRQIWLATDRAYKQAVEMLSKKKASLENKTRTDETPDFSIEDPATIVDVHPGKPIDLNQAEALARELSAVFRELPAIATSSVRIGATDEYTRYVNSEGSSFVREASQVVLTATAATQAADGFGLDDHYLVCRRGWEAMPPKAELLAGVRTLGTRVSALRDAALLEQYNGPVLFEDQAATEVFAQAFAPQLVGRRRPVTESNSSGVSLAMLTGGDNPFLDKIGARVLPDFLDVTDDATATELAGVPLYGDGRVDDEGVPTRKVPLVEKGRLKTLLVSRAPVRGVLKSTGSLSGNGPLPSNLIVSSAEGLEAAALKAELIKLVQQRGKEYGVVIRRLNNPLLASRQDRVVISSASRSGTRIEPAIAAFKVFADGHEEPLRNVEIAGLDAAAFKDIVAAGRTPYINTIPYRTAQIGNASTVSFAVPSLLFEDVTLKKPSGEIPKPPVSKHPFFDRT